MVVKVKKVKKANAEANAEAPPSPPEDVEEKESTEADSEELGSDEQPEDNWEDEISEEEVDPDKTKFELLHEFMQKTNDFLSQYDDLMENRKPNRSLWISRLSALRELLIALLHQFILNQLPRDDYLCIHIKCCGDKLMNKEDFVEHYQEAHSKANVNAAGPELETVVAYYKSVKLYKIHGRVVNKELLFMLRRLLRKTNTILKE
ncbi:uncharacterized protein LOC131432336 [Malaya genurostris]|uniref:uncharacterized protein LOC131432336 n=1 Tax=Malaya genurostris TaxID=325434 RepID=UPI0026F3CB00|nr:uncharacterized protein LOC131432336 [Malaya genurostris]